MNTAPTTPGTGRGFFTVGGTLPANAPSYIVREADTELAAHLVAGDFCYVLTSRQMGKSSLMVQTAVRLRREGMRVAVLDLTKIGQNLSPEQWYDGLLLRLGQEFGLEDEVDDFWTSSDEAVRRMGPMQRCMSALRQVILPSIPGKLVIFVDEIDAVRGLPFSTDEFFAGIRELYNSRTVDPELFRLTFCLLGVATPSDLIRNVSTTPFNIGYRVQLADFSPLEAAPLLQGLGKPPATGSRLLRRILWWTGGHPYLTQRLCANVAADSEVTSIRRVDQVCNRLFLSSRARETDDNLLFVRERVLRSDADRTSLLDLYERIRGRYRVPDDDANPLIDVLRLAGLIAVRENRLVVRNRIYERVFDKRWIRVNMPDAETRRQRVAFRKGVLRTAGIAVVVLAAIIGLGWYNLDYQQQAAIADYCAKTIQIQQAFDSGDYASGTNLLRQTSASVRQQSHWVKALLEAHMKYHPNLQRLLYSIQRNTYLYALANGFDRRVDRRFEWGYLVGRSDGDAAFAYVGHNNEVRSVAISSDGRLAATAGADSTVRIFDISNFDADSKDPPPLLRALAVLNAEHCKAGYALISSMNIQSVTEQMDKKLASCYPNRGAGQWPAPPGVSSVQFSPDGKWLAIGTGNARSPQNPGTVYLWSTQDPSIVVPVNTKHSKAVDAVAFRPRSDEFASTGEDNTVEFWRIERSGKVVSQGAFDASLLAGGGMDAAAYSPDGHTFAMAFGNGDLWIQGRPGPIMADVSGLMSLAFYDNNLILLGTRDGGVLKVDLRDKALEPERFLETGQGLVTSLTVSAQRDRLLTTGSTGTVLVWKLVKDKNDNLFAPGHSIMLRGQRNVTYSAAITPDERLIISGGADKMIHADIGRVFFWTEHSWPGGRVTWESQPKFILAKGAVKAFGFSPIMQSTQSCPKLDGAHKWVPVSEQVAMIRGVSARAGPDDPTEISFIPLDPCTGKPDSSRVDIQHGHKGAGTALAWTADGKYVVTAASDGTVLRWDARSHDHVSLEMPKDDQGHPIPVVALSAPFPSEPSSAPRGDDAWMAGAANLSASRTFRWHGQTYSEQGTIFFWKPSQSLKILKVLQRNSGRRKSETDFTLQTLAFSADGQWLAVCGSDNSVHILKMDSLSGESPAWPTIRSGTHPPYHSEHLQGQCTAVAFSPNGRWLAAGTSDRDVAVWSTDNWKRVVGNCSTETILGSSATKYCLDAPPKATAAINAIAFAPGSWRLAYGTADAKVQLWDVMAQLPLPTISVHSGEVLSLAFSPDGGCLASGSSDETLRFSCGVEPDFASKVSKMLMWGQGQPKTLNQDRPESLNWIPFSQ